MDGAARMLWWDCPYRRYANQRATARDSAGFSSTALTLSVSCMQRCCLLGWNLDVVLHHASLVAACLGLVTLIAWRRDLYVRWREPLFTLLVVHLAWQAEHTAVHARSWQIGHETPLLMFFLLALSTPALWLFLFAGCAQLTTAWAAIALPITALPSLLRGGAACRQLLSSPISAAPLARVYGMLSLAHSPELPLPAGPAAAAAAAAAGGPGPPGPLAMCMAVSGWSNLFFGVLLPMALTMHLEQRGRARFAAATAAAAGAARPAEAAAQADGERTLGATLRLLQLYPASCVAWAACCAAVDALLAWRGSSL